MDVIQSARERRSIRRFTQEQPDSKVLEELVDAARFAPSMINRQPLEYVLVTEKRRVEDTFRCLTLAKLVSPKREPGPHQRPTAYIVVCVNNNVMESGYEYEVGAAVQTIMLTAWEKGIGSCWVRNIDRMGIREIFDIPIHIEADSVIALGYPAEEPRVVESDGETDYYVDDQDVLNVPKRSLDSILQRH